MEIAKLQNLSKKELVEHLNREREELRKMRFKVHQGQLKNLRQIRETKKNIAELQTFMHRDK